MTTATKTKQVKQVFQMVHNIAYCYYCGKKPMQR